VTRPLRDGDVIAVGGSQFEIFAIPGHTLGSAAFLVHGVLFLGDSAAARSDGKIEPAPPVFSTDRTQNQQSLRQLATRLKDQGLHSDTRALLKALIPSWNGQISDLYRKFAAV
jgi:glyoxylase-like metal-dependent hydrolase (beta-lactamase superfamily II)